MDEKEEIILEQPEPVFEFICNGTVMQVYEGTDEHIVVPRDCVEEVGGNILIGRSPIEHMIELVEHEGNYEADWSTTLDELKTINRELKRELRGMLDVSPEMETCIKHSKKYKFDPKFLEDNL